MISQSMGRQYEVNGDQLVLRQSGVGRPTVVFLPGAGLVGLDYLNVHNAAAELTTSVLYDRGGTGWSDPKGLPRTASDAVDELHALLRVAEVPGPYLLVGHSLGAVYARRYAQRFPDAVAGMLLLDPYHEDTPARMPEEVAQLSEQMRDQPLPEPTQEIIEFFGGLFAGKLAQWPAEVRQPLMEYHRDAWRTGAAEAANVHEVGEEVRAGGAEPDVPVIVLSAMGDDPFRLAQLPERLERGFSDVRCALHGELAASFPRGEHRVLDDAGHNFMHVDRQDAVLQAIRDLLVRQAAPAGSGGA
ncbi:alpha/beta hydrolase [Solihabitans fulvus]|uniref:Alpha/beta hydrolase n=2 Tax=Solihabitans fulvus TaxID=1892852 RepID=A0A5B2XAB0_9PSEU|nr:alpha/beta hydrolase [Solihabitans fulvus]